MLNAILTIAKYSVMFICSFYGYLKLSKIKIKLIQLLDLLVAIALGTALYFATFKIRLLMPVLYVVFTFLYSFLRYRQFALNTVVYCIITCGITNFIMIIGFIISIPLEYIVFSLTSNAIVRDSIITAINCLLIFIITFLLYRIKRFKSGISINRNDGSVELLLLLSILSIFLLALYYTKNIASSPAEIITLTILFCGLAMIVWWKKHVTNNYLKQINKRNEMLYEKRIEALDAERKQLSEQNEELAKIIHRDNKLIPALVSAVERLIEKSSDKTDLQDLINQLESLSAEHRHIIENYNVQSDTIPEIENTAVSAVIHYLNGRAAQTGVSFKADADDGCIKQLLEIISDQTELNTILCDLGENAIIAAKDVEEGKLYIAFDKDNGGAPCISFYDNGAKFDNKVIANLGKKKITTHLKDGGSGIGLMTLFEILNKYNASFYLNEKLENGLYTKCVKVTFDNLSSVCIDTDGVSVVEQLPRSSK